MHHAQQELDNGILSGSLSHDQRVQAEANLDYEKSKQRLYEQMYGQGPTYDPGLTYGQSSTSTDYSYSGGGGVSISFRDILAYLLSLIAIAAIAYFCYDKIKELENANYPSGQADLVLFDVYYFPPKGKKPSYNELKSIMLEQFKTKYGALYSSQMPWDELYKDCTPQKRTCLINPYDSVQQLRSFALKPATLLEDMCAINGHIYHGTHIDFPMKPVWRVQFVENGKGLSSPMCAVANWAEYIEVHKNKLAFMPWIYMALGVIGAILSFMIIKRIVRP